MDHVLFKEDIFRLENAFNNYVTKMIGVDPRKSSSPLIICASNELQAIYSMSKFFQTDNSKINLNVRYDNEKIDIFKYKFVDDCPERFTIPVINLYDVNGNWSTDDSIKFVNELIENNDQYVLDYLKKVHEWLIKKENYNEKFEYNFNVNKVSLMGSNCNEFIPDGFIKSLEDRETDYFRRLENIIPKYETNNHLFFKKELYHCDRDIIINEVVNFIKRRQGPSKKRAETELKFFTCNSFYMKEREILELHNSNRSKICGTYNVKFSFKLVGDDSVVFSYDNSDDNASFEIEIFDINDSKEEKVYPSKYIVQKINDYLSRHKSCELANYVKECEKIKRENRYLVEYSKLINGIRSMDEIPESLYKLIEFLYYHDNNTSDQFKKWVSKRTADVITSIDEINNYEEYGYRICTNSYSIKMTLDPSIATIIGRNYNIITDRKDIEKFIGSTIIDWSEELTKYNYIDTTSEIFKLTNETNIDKTVTLMIYTNVGKLKFIGYSNISSDGIEYPSFKITKEYLL